MDKEKSLISLTEAVEAIKTAILQGQYEALKDVNRVQLAVYFAIGKYLSENTRKGVWGTGALKHISLQLKKEMPGLRGFSETQLKEMRSFYEGWEILDASTQQCKNLSVEISSVATDEINQCDLSVTTGELQMVNNQIDIYKAIKIPDIADFPIEDFFRVPFTHHTRIMAKCKDLSARYYYIHRTAEEHLSVDALEKIIKQQAFENRDKLPNNFSQTITNSSMARKAVMSYGRGHL